MVRVRVEGGGEGEGESESGVKALAFNASETFETKLF